MWKSKTDTTKRHSGDEMNGDEHAVHIFKDKGIVRANWQGESTIAPIDAPIYFEVFNFTTQTWERLDCDDSSVTGSYLVLEGKQLIPRADYYDSEGFAHHRVYQKGYGELKVTTPYGNLYSRKLRIKNERSSI